MHAPRMHGSTGSLHAPGTAQAWFRQVAGSCQSRAPGFRYRGSTPRALAPLYTQRVLRLPLGISIVLLAGCHSSSAVEPKAPVPAKSTTADQLPSLGTPERHILPVAVNGLSGLARVGDTLWSVAERASKLVAIRNDSASTVPIEGLEAGYDLESVAGIEEGRLALGTETSAELWASQQGQRFAKVFIVDVAADDTARVSDAISLPFEIWGVKPSENEGIEGLCSNGSMLLAGIETVKTIDGRRYAPLALRSLSPGSKWQPFFLQLSSSEGKLSSLDCRRSGKSTEVLAVERHFGVLRILYFRFAELPERPVQPAVLADLSDFIAADKLNVEGIAWGKHGDISMITDNEFTTITGPSELLTAPLE